MFEVRKTIALENINLTSKSGLFHLSSPNNISLRLG
jgi:hypothetical protein